VNEEWNYTLRMLYVVGIFVIVCFKVCVISHFCLGSAVDGWTAWWAIIH